MECTRPEISERLIMAVFPEDFPRETQKIQEHVHDCPVCRKELEMLQSLREAIREHRGELGDCVSGCPSPAEIVEYSLDPSTDSSVQRHIDHCCECKEEVGLVRELHGEDPRADGASTPTAEEKLVIRNAVLKEYGTAVPKPAFSFVALARSLLSTLHVPSMALGAVAAALLVAVLVPWTSKEAPSHLVLSDARWEIPAAGSMTKGVEVLTPPKKVALIIMVKKGAGLSAKEAGEIYDSIDLTRQLGDQYELISPAGIKRALEGISEKPSSVPDAARLVLAKTDADYVLAFRIGRSGSQVNLAGSLFERPHNRLLGFSSWDGVPKDLLAEKILRIGTGLMSAAE